MASLPEGTVTFLFTDIEGSTTLWEKHPDLMLDALDVHNRVLHKVIEDHGGVIFRLVGDAIYAAFSTVPQALSAAVEGQRGLSKAVWNEIGALKVRMGIHTGDAFPNEAGDYNSHTMNRVARVMNAGHGGQILLSEASVKLCERNMPAGVDFIDLGQHCMKGMTWLEHLYQVSGSGLEEHFPPLKTLDSYPHNLPSQLTSFLGREKEIAQIRKLMKASRLVTLIGPGGVGKTRISLEIAARVLEDFPDGVWFVELAHLNEIDSIPQAIAKAIGLHGKKDLSPAELICAFLERKKVLIVLDNCEHMVAACASIAEQLLTRSPRLSILSTSREAFRMQGETVFIVPPLNFPDPAQLPSFQEFISFEAVRLFKERTRAVSSDFELTEQNAYSIARICQHLDGIPLAIELAAARANMLTPDQMAIRLEDVFGLLSSGRRTALPHHQTLLATINWSYDLLSEKERKLLCRLAVFVGDWTIDTAEAVCSGRGISINEIFDLLCSLVNKSMIIAQQHREVEVCYHLLETIRQYAEEELLESGDADWAARQHFEFFLAEAEKKNDLLGGPRGLDAFMWFVREQSNLLAAFAWARSGTPAHNIPGADRLFEIMHHDWHGHGTHRLTGLGM